MVKRKTVDVIKSKKLILKSSEEISDFFKNAKSLIDDGFDVEISSNGGYLFMQSNLKLPTESKR